MSRYGDAAIKAVDLYKSTVVKSPKSAWERATRELFPSETSRNKGCTKDAFLGLCQEGLITGIPEGNYTLSYKNKRYAKRAVEILRESPELAKDLRSLWQCVMAGERKVHNSQMDVVVALWEAHLIK